MLQESVSMDSASSTEEIEEKRPIILDVRNSYEWDGGHFEGSQRPSEVFYPFRWFFPIMFNTCLICLEILFFPYLIPDLKPNFSL